MNYIGSKHTLSKFIKNTILKTVEEDISQIVFCDLFAGTGAISKTFKPIVKQVITNDIEYYSFVLNRNYVGNHSKYDYSNFLNTLNELEGVEGFVFQNYSEDGKAGRLYFSSENGKKIDAIRQEIEHWKTEEKINNDLYYYLLA